MTLSRCGDFEASITELSAVVDIYEARGDQYNIAHASMELAVCVAFAGRLQEAIVRLERARGIWSQLGNDHFLVQTVIALGVNYYLAGDFTQARTILNQGLDAAKRAGNLKWELYLLASIADIERDEGNLQQALETYTRAAGPGLGRRRRLHHVYLMDAAAGTCRLMGDIGSAESWAGRAMAEAEKTGGSLELGICLVTRGLIKRQQEDLKGSVTDFEQAITYLQEIGAWRELTSVHFHLGGRVLLAEEEDTGAGVAREGGGARREDRVTTTSSSSRRRATRCSFSTPPPTSSPTAITHGC